MRHRSDWRLEALSEPKGYPYPRKPVTSVTKSVLLGIFVR